MLPFAFDHRAPDYVAVFRHRAGMLEKLRAAPELWEAMRTYYREHPVDFIVDWGMTNDPRNIALRIPADMPFILFPRQVDFVEWVIARWRGRERGLAEKSRDMGLSWLMVGVTCWICLFHQGAVVGFGSRKEEYVDGGPKSLLWKARYFLSNLPVELRGGWERKRHAPYMNLTIPNTGSSITGEAGDNIGRGDRTTLHLVDETAHLLHPELTEASLSATTDCRIDVSSVLGMNNPFAVLRHSGKVSVFTAHWRDDPRKDDAWHAKKLDELGPIIVAQEIDISYTASVSGIVIPHEWVQAAVGAHIKLGFPITGAKLGALDVADEGVDKNAFAGRHGILLNYLDEWSGKGSDIFGTTETAIGYTREIGAEEFYYDADGLGAGVRGDAKAINERDKVIARPIEARPFRGSGAVIGPEEPITTASSIEGGDKSERLNQDYYANHKAQGWWMLRLRFQLTWRALQGHPIGDYDMLISIDPNLPHLPQLLTELSQPTYKQNGAGKLLIDKQPEGMRSPNLADSVMILYAPKDFQRAPMKINPAILGAHR